MEEAPSLSVNHAEKPTQINHLGIEPAAGTPPSETTATAAVPPSSGPQTTMKRKVNNGDYRNSTFFKIQKIVKDLRPYFIEIPQIGIITKSMSLMCYANACGRFPFVAAHPEMQNMMALTKQLQMDLKDIENSEKPTETQQHLPGESNPESMERTQEDKQTHPPLHTQKADKELMDQKAGLHGTYVIGGSRLGWNFTMFPGTLDLTNVYRAEGKAGRS